MCNTSIQAEPGTQTICPKCGATVHLASHTKDTSNTPSPTVDQLIDKIRQYQAQNNYQKMAEYAQQITHINPQSYDGWYFLAIAKSNIISQLIDQNQFNDNTLLEEIDTYYEKAYQYATSPQQIEKLQPLHSNFLKKNLIHAGNLTINYLQSIVTDLQQSIQGTLPNDQYASLSQEQKQDFIAKFNATINEQKQNLQKYTTLGDLELIRIAQRIMIKNNTK